MKKAKLFLVAAVLIAFTFCFFIKVSVANSPSTDGFLIEADRVEGTMLPPAMITGDTATRHNQPMLRLQYTDVTIYGLKITKVTQTPAGPVTIHMNAQSPIQLKNMMVDVTKVEFGEIYVPNQFGAIGLKNVRLVAHNQKAGNAELPNLMVSMKNGTANIDTSSDSEETLKALANQLTKLLKSGETDNQVNQQQNSSSTNNNTTEKDNTNSSESTPSADRSQTDNSTTENSQQGINKTQGENDQILNRTDSENQADHNTH